MNKKLYWGLGVLFILIIGGFVFLLVQQKAELNEWEADAAKDKKLAAAKKPPIVKNKPPPPEPGYEWVKHGDHYDKVPIAEANETPVKKTYDKPLTYDAELLETNPVKALRLQAEERGHWSAEWIPPFPPDDTEAQEFARVRYLMEYYWHNFGDLLETPGYEKEKKELEKVLTDHAAMYGIIRSYPYGARRCDLMKLTWPMTDKDVVSDSKGNVSKHPSNYFYDSEERAILKRAGMWQE